MNDTAMPDSLLEAEQRELSAFISLLETEQEALVTGNVDALLPLAKQKGALVTRLNRYGEMREGARSPRAMPVLPGCAAAAAQAPAASSTPDRWNALLDAASRAREINRRNGELIRDRLAQNYQALALLLSLSDQSALYGPDGRAHAGPGRRRLDIA